MRALVSFYPPRGDGKQIESAEVRGALNAKGVCFGVDWDSVTSSIQTCNTSHKTLVDVEVARGKRPSDEVEPRLELEPALLRKEAPENPEAQVVDFKELSPFQLVRKGDILARMSPRVEGVPGMDVLGRAIAYGKHAEKSIRPGRNTVTEGDSVAAGCDGRFVAGEDSFSVSEVLEISGDVDYSTGHIDFPGDVIVHGQIKQGFKVKAGGALKCAQTIDASEICCGGDLETDQGILGRMGSTVKAGGRIRAKFIENCTVEAGGDVFVSTGCLNSDIKALGAVSTGPKGVIIGGKLHARKGVTAFQIGSPTGARTEIYCGEDYRTQQRLAWIKEKNAELALKLKEVETRLGSQGQPDPRLSQLRDKLKAAIARMNNSAKELAAAHDNDEDVTVAARGDIHRGVSVEIRRVLFVVSRPLSAVRLVLDTTSNVITQKPLGR